MLVHSGVSVKLTCFRNKMITPHSSSPEHLVSVLHLRATQLRVDLPRLESHSARRSKMWRRVGSSYAVLVCSTLPYVVHASNISMRLQLSSNPFRGNCSGAFLFSITSRSYRATLLHIKLLCHLVVRGETKMSRSLWTRGTKGTNQSRTYRYIGGRLSVKGLKGQHPV